MGVVQVTSGFYSMNALDLVVWGLAWLLLARLAAHGGTAALDRLGLLLGLGLLNKVGLLVLGLGLLVARLPPAPNGAGSPRAGPGLPAPWRWS